MLDVTDVNRSFQSLVDRFLIRSGACKEQPSSTRLIAFLIRVIPAH